MNCGGSSPFFFAADLIACTLAHLCLFASMRICWISCFSWSDGRSGSRAPADTKISTSEFMFYVWRANSLREIGRTAKRLSRRLRGGLGLCAFSRSKKPFSKGHTVNHSKNRINCAARLAPSTIPDLHETAVCCTGHSQVQMLDFEVFRVDIGQDDEALQCESL